VRPRHPLELLGYTNKDTAVHRTPMGLVCVRAMYVGCGVPESLLCTGCGVVPKYQCKVVQTQSPGARLRARVCVCVCAHGAAGISARGTNTPKTRGKSCEREGEREAREQESARERKRERERENTPIPETVHHTDSSASCVHKDCDTLPTVPSVGR
jgi:hypothetical protein